MSRLANPAILTDSSALRQAVEADAAEVLRIRRCIHARPELSWQERETATFVAEELSSLGLNPQTGLGGLHAVKAVIEGGRPGPVIALRADMDALPIVEASGLNFASERPGVMHACGHDAHTAMLLGAARLLSAPQVRAELPGTLVLIFQPAEERAPGGAVSLIKAGVLDSPRVDLVLGQHVNPEFPAGSAAFRPGLMMASVDDLFVTFRGSGGHGALPHRCVDPILAAAQAIVGAQALVAREADPQVPTVLSFGRIAGEGSNNIIPGEVKLDGTFRTVDETWRAEALERVAAIITDTARAHRAEATVELLRGYPALRNHEGLCNGLAETARGLLGTAAVHEAPLFMGAEDFAYYARERPACFWYLGSGHPTRPWNPPLHHPGFDIDESALLTGVFLMAGLALAALKGGVRA